MDSLEDRLVSLEEKFSHQDDLMSKLNIIIADQENVIGELVEAVMEFKSAMGATDGGMSVQNAQDDKPPHY